MKSIHTAARAGVMSAILAGCLVAHAQQADTNSTCGNVGLRPLPRFEQDLKSNHGGPWAGMPTFGLTPTAPTSASPPIWSYHQAPVGSG